MYLERSLSSSGCFPLKTISLAESRLLSSGMTLVMLQEDRSAHSAKTVIRALIFIFGIKITQKPTNKANNEYICIAKDNPAHLDCPKIDKLTYLDLQYEEQVHQFGGADIRLATS